MQDGKPFLECKRTCTIPELLAGSPSPRRDQRSQLTHSFASTKPLPQGLCWPHQGGGDEASWAWHGHAGLASAGSLSPRTQPERWLQGAAGRERFWRSITAIWQGLHMSGWVPTATIGIIKSRSCTAKQPQLTPSLCVWAALHLCMKPRSKTSPCCCFGHEPACGRAQPVTQQLGALPLQRIWVSPQRAR